MSNTDLEHLRHSLAHLMAAAVLELWPDAKPTIGPVIENGFFYDFDFGDPISENDLLSIETKMKEILPTWDEFREEKIGEKEAKKIFAKNPYKLELIKELANEELTIYKSGNFTDLCRGGHIDSAKKINPNSFKLTHIAGAYWRGDEKNKMLTRIYGVAFTTEKELGDYLIMIEEAKNRDHRKLGKDLKIFFFDDLVGKGLPLWLPRGTIIKNEIEKMVFEVEEKYGYQRVSTPNLAKEQLYLMSGHLPYYKDSMYPAMTMDDGIYYLKAMNCPHHHIIFKSEPRSYRDLPIRLAEYGTCHRNELSGTLAGLLRVRTMQMNDAHIYCTKDQIEDEFKKVMEMTLAYFKIFGLDDYWFQLSKWDPKNKEKYINEPENWEFAEEVLRKILKKLDVKFIEAEDEAAFYGPKVDVLFKSIIGRKETMSTIQLDFAAKKRFKLTYTDRDGKDNNEVFVIHRAPLSTHERFIAFLLEHYSGAFPLWLSPVQVAVLTIADTFEKYGQDVCEKIKSAGIRCEGDFRDESIGKKIRESELQKIPYLLIIGQKEITAGKVAVRRRNLGDIGQMEPDGLVADLKKEIELKK